MDPGVSRRLLLAVAASVVLHWSLLYTVQVVPPLRPPPTALHARLELNDVQPAPRAAATRPRLTPRVSAVRDAGPAAEPNPVEQAAGTAAAAPAGMVQPITDAPAPLPALELPVPLDTTWYTARQLDVYPQPLSMPQPVYPEPASANGVHGEVTLLVLVDEAGTVREVSVVEAQPEGYFEAAALAAYQDVRFEPARKDGRPVRSRVLIKVAFDPGSRP